MKKLLRMLALTLALTMLLTGCGLVDVLVEELENFAGEITATEVPGTVPPDSEYLSFSQMEYVRPEIDTMDSLSQAVIAAAETETDPEVLVEDIEAFLDEYAWFYTYYSLADIHYCIDMTDAYWQEEYNYCMDQAGAVEIFWEDMMYALAASAMREALEGDNYFGADYFDAYEGENIYDDTYTALIDEETELMNQYYKLSADAASVEFGSEEYYEEFGEPLAQILVDLIRNRQAQAAHCGYDSYPEYAYDTFHGRDFTPQQTEEYTVAVAQQLTGLYCNVNKYYDWEVLYDYCTQKDMVEYVRATAEAMGGDIAEGYQRMYNYGLYHVSPDRNKFNSSFEVYLHGYDQGFVFVNPVSDPSDKLTFAHEFGHYLADYYTWGSNAGTDVLEVHSQGMEYLSLVYNNAEPDLVEYAMIRCLNTYIEQSAYALFEQRMYGLEGEALTVEALQALYEETCLEFGFDSWAWDSRDFVTVPHFYELPMYVISYVVSNDLALQIYRLELEEPGTGLELYDAILSSDDTYVMEFAEAYGLDNPLDAERLPAVKEILNEKIDL